MTKTSFWKKANGRVFHGYCTEVQLPSRYIENPLHIKMVRGHKAGKMTIELENDLWFRRISETPLGLKTPY